MKPGDKFKVREGAPFRFGDGRLGVVCGLKNERFSCHTMYGFDDEECVVSEPGRHHFFIKDCIPSKSKADIIIEYMERKAEVIAVLTDGKVRDFFIKEDADEIRGWDDGAARYILSQLTPCLGVQGCPFCIKHCIVCECCGYGTRHGYCASNNIDNTYGRVMHYIKELPDTYVQELKGILEQ